MNSSNISNRWRGAAAAFMAVRFRKKRTCASLARTAFAVDLWASHLAPRHHGAHIIVPFPQRYSRQPS